MKLVLAGVLAIGLAGLTVAGAELCLLDGERVSGTNRICFYSCPSGTISYTVRMADLCPLNLTR